MLFKVENLNIFCLFLQFSFLGLLFSIFICHI